MKEAKDAEKFKTLLVIVTGLVVFHFIFKSKNFLYAAIAVGVLSLAIPAVANGIVWGWMKLSEGLGWVNSRVIMGLIFFIFLTPIAFIARIFKKDPLHLKDNGLKSVFKERGHLYTKADLENTW